jgi:hypothetical protein
MMEKNDRCSRRREEADFLERSKLSASLTWRLRMWISSPDPSSAFHLKPGQRT